MILFLVATIHRLCFVMQSTAYMVKWRLTVLMQASFLRLRDAGQQTEGTDTEPIVICVWKVVMLKRVCRVQRIVVCHQAPAVVRREQRDGIADVSCRYLYQETSARWQVDWSNSRVLMIEFVPHRAAACQWAGS